MISFGYISSAFVTNITPFLKDLSNWSTIITFVYFFIFFTVIIFFYSFISEWRSSLYVRTLTAWRQNQVLPVQWFTNNPNLSGICYLDGFQRPCLHLAIPGTIRKKAIEACVKQGIDPCTCALLNITEVLKRIEGLWVIFHRSDHYPCLQSALKQRTFSCRLIKISLSGLQYGVKWRLRGQDLYTK